MRYLGIDPGASGGLVLLASGEEEWFSTWTLGNSTDRQTWGFINGSQADFCCIEKVGGYIAGNPAPGSAMFNFGANYGRLIGFLVASEIPFEQVTPQRWQKALAIPTKVKKGKGRMGETKTEFKRRLRAHAERLFPKVSLTNALADAILIAEFCRRSRTQGVQP